MRATWLPSTTRRYRRPDGPWDGPSLDTLLSRQIPRPDPAIVVDGACRLDAGAVAELVDQLAGGLRARGVRHRSAVAWQLPNSLAAFLLLRACWRIGAIAAPLLHTFGSSEAAVALRQVDPVLQIDLDDAALSDPDRLIRALGGPPISAVHSVPRAADLAVALFTSGSTGVPKAVLHTHRGLSWKARLMSSVHGLGPRDAVLMPAPLAHISGMLNGVLLPGACGMKSLLLGRFDPDEALSLVDAERVSFLAGPPTFFVAMARAMQERGHQPPSTLRLVSTGGASVTPAFVEETTARLACRVKRTYGSTEAPTITTSTGGDPWERARDTEGRAVGEVELRVVDPETHRPLEPGAPGELWVRGPELFAGYAEPSQTREVTAPGGWFRTGDLATVDKEGWLTIVGRLKDVIIRGGENISASEVEGVLEAHPAIRHAVAVGYPDELMGERVAAFVVADSPVDLELCDAWFAAQGIARFKTPERVVQLDRLPLLGTGKPDRAALRTMAAP